MQLRLGVEFNLCDSMTLDSDNICNSMFYSWQYHNFETTLLHQTLPNWENNSTMKQIKPKMTHARIHNSNLWWQTSDNHLSEVDWGHAWHWSKWVFHTT